MNTYQSVVPWYILHLIIYSNLGKNEVFQIDTPQEEHEPRPASRPATGSPPPERPLSPPGMYSTPIIKTRKTPLVFHQL